MFWTPLSVMGSCFIPGLWASTWNLKENVSSSNEVFQWEFTPNRPLLVEISVAEVIALISPFGTIGPRQTPVGLIR